MSKWTDEQQLAIDSSGVSVIVSAAAGSGKTSVLVEHIIKIISETDENGNVKVPANQMVIVTFTNDAAAEMKHRLSKRISEKISEKPNNPALRQQQSLLQYAKISTIHSFCIDIIRDNVHKTDFSAGFRIIEENEEKLIINSCIDETIEDGYKNFPEDMDLLYNYFCNENDEEIETLLFNIYEFICKIPFSNQWLDNICESFSNAELIDNTLNEYCCCIADSLEIYLKNILTIQKILEENSDSSEKAEKAIQIIDDEYKLVSDIINLIRNDYKSVFNMPFKTSTLTLKNVFEDEITKRVQALRNQYKKKINEALEKLKDVTENYEQDIKSHYEICCVIKKLIHSLKEKINEVKIDKNGISFSDAENIALNLLADRDENGNLIKSEIAYQLSQFYKIIMVDEFQDTNDNQNKIFTLISDTGDYNASVKGKNLFFVGDVKQSIYGFRLANPKIFIDTIKNSIPYKHNNSENSYIKLNKNFRSSSKIIDFVNFIFSKIMNMETAETEYNEDKLICSENNITDDINKNTEICIINAEDSKSNEKSVLNAKWIAFKINEMIKNKFPVTDKDGQTRPCENRDFCILLRDKTKSSVYAEELSKFGIFSYFEEKEGFTKLREISLVLNLMRVVDNPLLDIPLTSVMLSPMFSMTADDVTQLRLLNREKSMYTSLTTAVEIIKNAEKDENGNTIIPKDSPIKDKLLLEKAEKIYDTINELRIYSATDTLEQLIRRIYECTDFLSVMQIYDGGEKKKANLRILIEYAKNYENSSNGGLSGFLRFIEKSSQKNDSGFKHGSASSGSENVVSIKTMHKSKGLEYPFVFIGGTEKQFNTRDITHSFIITDREKGFGFVLNNPEILYKYTTLPCELIRLKKKKNLLSEEMRLLYVALTRAKEKLFIPIVTENKKIQDMSVKVSDELDNNIILSASSMQDWILMALLSDEQINNNISKLFNISNKTDNSNPDINFSYMTADELIEIEYNTTELSEEDTKKSENAEDIKNKIKEMFDFFKNTYDFKNSTLPAKLSVSDISKSDDDFDIPLKRPKFIQAKKKLTGAEIGTALHTFMQYADFDEIVKNPENELNVCVNKGFITQKERECIKVEKIMEFTSSDLFRRIQNSNKFTRERRFMISLKDVDTKGIVPEKYEGNNIILQGIADIAFNEDDGLVVVDYKTDYATSEENLIEKYRNQILLYKFALEKIEGIKVKECILYSFHFGKELNII